MRWIKNAFFVSFITMILLVLLEIGARAYVYHSYGSASAGLGERTTNLNYKVFTMWGKDLDALAEAYLSKTPKGRFRILLLGGSTAQAVDESLIEQEFAAELALKGGASVFNAASGGFNIRQEGIALLLVASKIKPDLILVLDGANDIQHSLRPGVDAGTTYVDKTYKQILEKPYLAPLIYLLQHSQLYNGMLRLFDRKAFDERDHSKPLSGAKNVYLQTRKFIHDYATGAQVPIVFMLQPHVAFSVAPEDAEAKKRFSYREKSVMAAFSEIAKQTEDKLCFVDANQRLQLDGLRLKFTDDVHFKDDAGYRHIASLFREQYRRCYKRSG